VTRPLTALIDERHDNLSPRSQSSFCSDLYRSRATLPLARLHVLEQLAAKNRFAFPSRRHFLDSTLTKDRVIHNDNTPSLDPHRVREKRPIPSGGIAFAGGFVMASIFFLLFLPHCAPAHLCKKGRDNAQPNERATYSTPLVR